MTGLYELTCKIIQVKRSFPINLVIRGGLGYYLYMTAGSNKIIRTLCSFENNVSDKTIKTLESWKKDLESENFNVQTLRISLNNLSLKDAANLDLDPSIFISAGTVNRIEAESDLNFFLDADNVSFNIEPDREITIDDVNLLFRIIKERPEKTFNFAFTFNNVHSSPFFPSSNFRKTGFSVGMQPTDLSEGCSTLDEWFINMKKSWSEIIRIFGGNKLIGIDSSIAPLYSGKSSLINFVKKMGGTFTDAVTSDTFLKISRFIREKNPLPAGLCGIMFPCLEDFELAEEYESGNFSIERNIFLSLHSGLGIDTYPVAKNESPERVLQVLKLLSGLSDKYKKPLAARFVSDGKSNLGEKSSFNNKYLKDVVLRKL